MPDLTPTHDLADPCMLCYATRGADAKRHTPDEVRELNNAIPVRPRGTWSQELARPFPANEIANKPRLWCADCRKAADKVCNRHHRVKCETCKQNITDAHLHLSYVGHADITRRLLEVDPYWSWKPAYHAVDHDLLMAAIASGNEKIVDSLIANAPPLRDQYGGMWMVLTVHDDEGKPVETLGYGDHEDKPPGPQATKELIGDGIRNASMRRGLALDLWSKSDRAEDERQQLAAEAAEAKTDAKSAAKTDTKAPATRRSRGRASAEPDGQAVVAAQQLANLAFEMAERYANLRQAGKMNEPVGAVVDRLGVETMAKAKTQSLLSVHVYSKFTGTQITLNEAIREARQRIEDVNKVAMAQGAGKAEGEGSGEASE